MKRLEFVNQFKALLPEYLSETSIDTDDIEISTLLFIGNTISKMTDEAQTYFDENMLDDTLIDITARHYSIEW